jgi:hypothetical protein
MSDVSTPHELMAQIEADARSLDSGARRLAKAIQELAGFAQRYERDLQQQLITIYDEAKHTGERMPAEDVRRAMAQRGVDHATYASFLSKQAEVEALKAWTRATASVLSARQTLLNVLRDELRVAS